MRIKTLRVFAGATAVALSLAACSGPASDADSAPDDAAAAGLKGGIAVVALPGEPDVLDPTFANTYVARDVFASFCEKLYDTDENLNVIPQLAADLPVISADGLTVDITLRDGIQFNDGTALDAEAVKITLDRGRSLETSARKSELASIKAVEVTDALTVRLTLNAPHSPLTSKLADRSGMIMSPKALDELGEEFGTAPVCVGPFQFEDRVAGSEVSFVKSDYYYDADKVNLDGVTYKFIVDPNIRAANIRSGDIHVAERMHATDAVQLEGTPGIEIKKVASMAYQALAINVDPSKTNGPLATSAELRKAFELSIDRDALNKVVFHGQNVPDCIPFPTSSEYHPETAKCHDFDPAAARKILKESGAQLPVPVEFMISARPTDQQIGEVIQQMANAVGFEVTLKPVETLASEAAARAGDFEVFLYPWSGRIDPDGNLTNIVTTGGGVNFSQLSDAELDGLIADGAAATDVDDRKASYAKVLERLGEVVPGVYLFHDTLFLGLSGITGVGFTADGIPRLKTAALTE